MLSRSVSDKTPHGSQKLSLPGSGVFDDTACKIPLGVSPVKVKNENGLSSLEVSIFELKYKEFLSIFRYLWIPNEDIKQLLLLKEKELVDNLNTRINNFMPESQANNVRFFDYKGDTLISLVAPSSRTLGARMIFRNITGRFAWEFSHIACLKASAMEKATKSFEELNESVVTFECPNVYDEEDSKKAISIKVDMLPKKTISDKLEQKDPFRELLAYVKENIQEYEEVFMSFYVVWLMRNSLMRMILLKKRDQMIARR